MFANYVFLNTLLINIILLLNNFYCFNFQRI